MSVDYCDIFLWIFLHLRLLNKTHVVIQLLSTFYYLND